MIKIVQFGEGNFLRTFVDAYFDNLNKDGNNEYSVDIIKPIPFGSLDKFKKQNCKYNIVLRGVKDGKLVEDAHHIDVVKNAIDPFCEKEKFFSLALDADLKIIVSNTTEAGICFDENDKNEAFEKTTYPYKLTKFLFERYRAGLGGLYILPCELIDKNADNLFICVEKYIGLLGLPDGFRKWNQEENYYCNTLVDRIVSGHPKDEATLNHLFELVGEKDELVSVGEPFGLWAIEKKGQIEQFIKEGKHNIDVVLTESIDYYKKRKVRVLNGSHTNIVPIGLWNGKITVDECLSDQKLARFLDNTLKYEIIPFVSDNIEETEKFANSVKERFANPFLNHQLTSIALNSISKWNARNLPSFKDYYSKNGKIPLNLTVGFSYLCAIYSSVYKKNGKYFVDLPSRTVELVDSVDYLEYFANGGSVEDFMKNQNIFSQDLTMFKDFVDTVIKNVNLIKQGKEIL